MRDGNSTPPGRRSDDSTGSATSADAVDAAGSSEPGAVHVIVSPDRTRIVLSGEVDADLGAELQEATAEAELRGLPIEVDAHHVTFMDSSGVAFLARLAIRSQHRVQLLRVPPTVRFLLDVTRIGELLDVVPDDGAPEDQPGEGRSDDDQPGTGAPGDAGPSDPAPPAAPARTPDGGPGAA